MSQHQTKITDLLREIVAYCREAGHEWSSLSDAEAALSATQPAQAAQGAGEVVAPNDHNGLVAASVIGLASAIHRIKAGNLDGATEVVTRVRNGLIAHGYMLDTKQPGADVWQPMSTAPSQKTVLLAVCNEYGRIRTVLARHVTRFAEVAGEDDQATEYRESDDTHYVTPGWYESNTEAEINYGITGEFLGWMSAPKWVGAAIAASGRQE